jgi:hypothetical protein
LEASAGGAGPSRAQRGAGGRLLTCAKTLSSAAPTAEHSHAILSWATSAIHSQPIHLFEFSCNAACWPTCHAGAALQSTMSSIKVTFSDAAPGWVVAAVTAAAGGKAEVRVDSPRRESGVRDAAACTCHMCTHAHARTHARTISLHGAHIGLCRPCMGSYPARIAHICTRACPSATPIGARLL